MAPQPTPQIDNTQALLPAEQAAPPDLARRATELAARTNLDPKKVESIAELGAEPQRAAAKVADSLLQSVKVKDAGQAGVLLGQLTTHLKSVDCRNLHGSALEKASHIPLVGGLIKKAAGAMVGYEGTLKAMEQLTGQLTTARTTILGDVDFLGKLYDQNLASYKDLLVWIEVCKIKMQELDGTIIPAAQAKAAQTKDGLDAQAVADLQAHRTRLDKRRTDLEITRTLRLQAAPKIRLIQAGNIQLAENLQSSIINGVPLFKENLAIAIVQGRQKEAAQVQDDFTDSLNAMIKQGADMLHENSVQIAKQTQRGVVDVATLQHQQEQLLLSITEVQAIVQQGEKDREAARTTIEGMEHQLKEKLVA